jgi:hypothetical protein
MKKLVNKVLPFLIKGFYYIMFSAFIMFFVVAASVIKISDLFILEIVLFGNLAFMILIIPVMVYLRK